MRLSWWRKKKKIQATVDEGHYPKIEISPKDRNACLFIVDL